MSFQTVAKSTLRLLIGITSFQSVAFSADTKIPSIKIEELSYSGSGCDAGSGVTHVSDDKLAYTSFFDSFTSTVDSPSRRNLNQKYCDLNFRLSAPNGWSYALMGVDVRGYAQTDARSSAKIEVSYQTRRAFIPVKVKSIGGSFADDYLVRTQAPAVLSTWSECGVTQNFNIRTTVTTRGFSATTSVDSIDGQLRDGIHVIWRRCP